MGDMHLYAAFDRLPARPDVENVTIQFFDEKGENEYTEYQMTVPVGTTITMPRKGKFKSDGLVSDNECQVCILSRRK